MAPRKAAPTTEAGVASPSLYTPEEAQFFFQCLQAFDADGVMNLSVLSKAAGHTNLGSTRNAFNRYKKRYGFGNIPTKTGDGQPVVKGQDIKDEPENVAQSVEGDALKPKNGANKVTKKRGRPSAASKKAVAAAAASAEEEHDENTEITASTGGVKTEQGDSDTD